MEGLSPLIQVAALCQMLLEALERVDDDEIATEPLLDELQGLLSRAHET